MRSPTFDTTDSRHDPLSSTKPYLRDGKRVRR